MQVQRRTLKVYEITINTVFSLVYVHEFAKVYSAKCILSSNSPKFPSIQYFQVTNIVDNIFNVAHRYRAQHLYGTAVVTLQLDCLQALIIWINYNLPGKANSWLFT